MVDVCEPDCEAIGRSCNMSSVANGAGHCFMVTLEILSKGPCALLTILILFTVWYLYDTLPALHGQLRTSINNVTSDFATITVG